VAQESRCYIALRSSPQVKAIVARRPCLGPTYTASHLVSDFRAGHTPASHSCRRLDCSQSTASVASQAPSRRNCFDTHFTREAPSAATGFTFRKSGHDKFMQKKESYLKYPFDVGRILRVEVVTSDRVVRRRVYRDQQDSLYRERGRVFRCLSFPLRLEKIYASNLWALSMTLDMGLNAQCDLEGAASIDRCNQTIRHHRLTRVGPQTPDCGR
jgi:hypothetical protein